MSKVLKAVGAFLAGVLNAAKKAFLSLTPEQQEAVKSGSGIMDMINKYLDETPGKVRELILSKFPDLKLPELEAALFRLSRLFNLGDCKSADDVIDAIQNKIKTVEGIDWENISQAYALAMGIALAPKGTKIFQIVSALEWAYRKFFKKSV